MEVFCQKSDKSIIIFHHILALHTYRMISRNLHSIHYTECDKKIPCQVLILLSLTLHIPVLSYVLLSYTHTECNELLMNEFAYTPYNCTECNLTFHCSSSRHQLLTLHTLVQNVTCGLVGTLPSYTPYARTECNSKSIQKYGSAYVEFIHRISISRTDITLLSIILLV